MINWLVPQTIIIMNKSKRYITPEEYESLSIEDQDWYGSEWKEHKERRVRSYDECDSCGHRCFNGWVTESTPVGSPYRYRLLNGMAANINALARYYDRKFLEQSNLNVLHNHII
jgi:hypothetical protein